MSLTTTLILGFIAGVTIVFGLPIGRMRRPAPQLRIVLNAVAVGILMFLFWDVLKAAWEPIDSALTARHDGTGGLGPVFGYGFIFVVGLSVGLLSLVGYDRYLARMGQKEIPTGPNAQASTAPDTSIGSYSPTGPDSAGSTLTAVRAPVQGIATWSPARRLSLLIAVGIGLHNFAEGLAIGQAAASGAIALATVLVVGFALHNATEGFGIVAPLAAERQPDGSDSRPSWGFLLAMAAIGGGPTFIGTLVGRSFTSEPTSVAFLTLAAGSIVYVITQLLAVAARAKRTDLVSYGILLGLLAGFITDAIVTAGGA